MLRARFGWLAVALLLAGCHDAQSQRPVTDVDRPLDPALSSSQPLGADLDAQIKSTSEQALESLGAAARGWTVATTPAIPSRWPPSAEICVYVYGYKLDPMVMDGQHTGDVWARLVITKAGIRVEKLADEIGDLGIQGVRPVAKAEAEQQDAALKRLRQQLLSATGLAGLDQRAFSEAYGKWQQWNGVIAKSIAGRHPEFAAWVGIEK